MAVTKVVSSPGPQSACLSHRSDNAEYLNTHSEKLFESVCVCVCACAHVWPMYERNTKYSFWHKNKTGTQKMVMYEIIFVSVTVIIGFPGRILCVQPPPACPSGFSLVTSSGHIASPPTTPVWMPHPPVCSLLHLHCP